MRKPRKKIETQIVHLAIPLSIMLDVDRFQADHGYTTRTSAILELLRKALQIQD